MRALFLPQDGESATILFCLWQALFQRFDSGIIFRSQFQGLIQKQSILCVWHMNSLSFSECPICTILLTPVQFLCQDPNQFELLRRSQLPNSGKNLSQCHISLLYAVDYMVKEECV